MPKPSSRFSDILILKEKKLYYTLHPFKYIYDFATSVRESSCLAVIASNAYRLHGKAMDRHNTYVVELDRIEVEVAGYQIKHGLYVHATEAEENIIYVPVINGAIFMRKNYLEECVQFLEPFLREKMLQHVYFSQGSCNETIQLVKKHEMLQNATFYQEKVAIKGIQMQADRVKQFIRDANA